MSSSPPSDTPSGLPDSEGSVHITSDDADDNMTTSDEGMESSQDAHTDDDDGEDSGVLAGLGKFIGMVLGFSMNAAAAVSFCW